MSEHDVCNARRQEPMEIEYQLRGFLKVGSDDGHVVPPGARESGGDGRKRSEVSTELDELRTNGPRGKAALEDIE